jgi:hypothetical protein
MKAKLFGLVAALATFGDVSLASAGTVTFYDTQSAFNAASSAPLLDDFSFPHSDFAQTPGTASLTRNGVTYTDPYDVTILTPGGSWNFGAAS